MYHPVITSGFKFLKVIIESLQVHKYRIDARYLHIQWLNSLYTTEVSIK